ncbi:hypothetical protein [Stagnihabitans tardus]|uniref:DUF2497 domain-containing protein n=1 Tax=Stagnihabitans tardus TaxID=2699202 RepID=A0AAE5BVB8_9RHOB|nr:hypothetical protein [Stagnihabitans tardus]NBZ88731.1 hypothetical protein [Stagnihabitans tardus]
MSDAKTAAEIEDILSSIRRLVSQDRKQATAQRPQILSRLVVEDRLILTPAQRVKPAPSRPVATVTPLKRPEAPFWPETAESVAPRPVDEARVVKPAEAPKPQVAPVASPEPLGRLHLKPAPVEAKPADALAWEAEMGDAAPDLASLDWSSFTFARRPMAETYAARSRAAERLVASQPARSAPKVQEVPPTDLSAPPSAAEEAEPVEPILQEEDSIFSEEVLRELVRDLIREQLQGDLGERITRNIRKLVKAEIARAISVQSLE